MIGRFSNLSKSLITKSCSNSISKPSNYSGLVPLTPSRCFASNITRLGLDNPNMSQVVVHNGIVYISGQVDDTGSDVKAQTTNILDKVDSLLAQAGTDKSKLLTASIWVKDIGQDFQDMNSTWNTWLDSNNKPVRATGMFIIYKEEILASLTIIKVNLYMNLHSNFFNFSFQLLNTIEHC